MSTDAQKPSSGNKKKSGSKKSGTPKASEGKTNDAAVTLERKPELGMNPVPILTGLYGSRGERIRHSVHDGALKLPKDALTLLDEATEETGLASAEAYELPGLDCVVRPSVDPALDAVIITDISLERATVPDPSASLAEEPKGTAAPETKMVEVIRTKIENRTIRRRLTVPSSPRGEDQPGIERIRGGGEGEQKDSTEMEIDTEQSPAADKASLLNADGTATQAEPAGAGASLDNADDMAAELNSTGAPAAEAAPKLSNTAHAGGRGNSQFTASTPQDTAPTSAATPDPLMVRGPSVAAPAGTPAPVPAIFPTETAVSVQPQNHLSFAAPAAAAAPPADPAFEAPAPTAAIPATPSVAAPAKPASSVPAISGAAAPTSPATIPTSSTSAAPGNVTAPALPAAVAPARATESMINPAAATKSMPVVAAPAARDASNSTKGAVPVLAQDTGKITETAVPVSGQDASRNAEKAMPSSARSSSPGSPNTTKSGVPTVQTLSSKPEPRWELHRPGPNDEMVTPEDQLTPKPAWYRKNGIADVERTMLPEWFDGSASHRTPESYVKARETILTISDTVSNRNVTTAMVRRSIVGDAGSLQRLRNFMSKWGLINEDAINDSAPTAPVLREQYPVPKEFDEQLRVDLMNAVVEQASKRRKTSADNSFVPIDWEQIALRVGKGATSVDCERNFLYMPINAESFSENGAANSDRPITPEGSQDTPEAYSEPSKDAARQEFLRELVDGCNPAVLSKTTQAALQATNDPDDLKEAQSSAVLGLVASRAVQEAQKTEKELESILTQLLDQRMRKLENRMAMMDDVESILEAEKVALELERRDLYTARCRHWFGGT